MTTSMKSENKPRKPQMMKPGGPLLAKMPDRPVAFMDPRDLGKLHVPASERIGRRAIPAYSADDVVDAGVVDIDGVDTIKVLMATDYFIMFEAARAKGAIDTAHIHPDHHAVVFLKKGRVRMMIDNQWYIVEEGDSYYHPLGVVHQHEPLVDCIRVETKIYPNGGAIAAWNNLVGGSPASGLS